MIGQVVDDMVRIRGMIGSDAEEYVRMGTPMERMQTMDEVADMVAMAILAPGYMTGSVLEAPGGAG